MRIMWSQRTKSGPLRLKYGTVYSSRISCKQTIPLMKPLKPQTWVELLRTHTHARTHRRFGRQAMKHWILLHPLNRLCLSDLNYLSLRDTMCMSVLLFFLCVYDCVFVPLHRPCRMCRSAFTLCYYARMYIVMWKHCRRMTKLRRWQWC